VLQQGQVVGGQEHEIVERELVTGLLQPGAGGNHLGGRLDGLEDLDDHLFLRQHGGVIAEQQLLGEVDQRSAAAGDVLDPDGHERVDDDLRRRMVGVSAIVPVLRPGAIEQLVGDGALALVEHRLPRDVDVSRL